MSEQRLWEKAQQLYKKMEPAINRLGRTMMRFDPIMDMEDFKQQAWIALKMAVSKYSKRRSKEMKIESFAFWYLQKYFSVAADTDRVIYDIYDGGKYLKSLPGGDYVKRKGTLPPNHTVRTRRVFVEPTDRDWLDCE